MQADAAVLTAVATPTIALGDRILRVSDRKGGRLAFWRRVEIGGWEASTLSFVHEATDADTTFIDIGAWIGPVSLVGAARAKRIIAIEPDPVALEELEELVALNDMPIEVWRAGINAGTGSLKIYSTSGFGDTVTSALGNSANAKSVDVDCVTFDDITNALGVPPGKVVVKIDVEGHEFSIGEAFAAFVHRHRAVGHLSVHSGILYHNLRRRMGPLRARLQVFKDTRALLGKLAAGADVRWSKTGRRITPMHVASFVFLRRFPKNFSVNVLPQDA